MNVIFRKVAVICTMGVLLFLLLRIKEKNENIADSLFDSHEQKPKTTSIMTSAPKKLNDRTKRATTNPPLSPEIPCTRIENYNISMCHHQVAEDNSISGHLASGKLFSQPIVDRVLLLIKKDEYFFDLGTNIGSITFPVASKGYKVFSFEPFPPNIEVIHKSIEVNKYQDRVKLFEFGISDGRYNMSIDIQRKNLGRVRLTRGNCLNEGSIVCSSYKAYTRTLDDVLEYLDKDVKNGFMKVDIEGQERQAILGGTNFLQKIKICTIIMEWQWFKRFYSRNPKEIKHSEKMISALKKLGYKPFSMDEVAIGDKDWKKQWPEDVIWKRQDEACVQK